MKYFEYENKEEKTKAIAIDAMDVIGAMAELEEYNGVTKERIMDNWYKLKLQVKEIVLAQVKSSSGDQDANVKK